jgi:hypothetical protein
MAMFACQLIVIEGGGGGCVWMGVNCLRVTVVVLSAHHNLVRVTYLPTAST